MLGLVQLSREFHKDGVPAKLHLEHASLFPVLRDVLLYHAYTHKETLMQFSWRSHRDVEEVWSLHSTETEGSCFINRLVAVAYLLIEINFVINSLIDLLIY